MEKIALEIARLNETLKILVSIAKEEIRKSEELSKKYEEERKKMKKYKVTLHEEFYVKAEDEEAAAWNALEGLDIGSVKYEVEEIEEE
jgi:hypothetical protein